jgi:hypothetical protein
VEGVKVLELCEKGDQLLDDEVSKVYKGKKLTKGMWMSGETFTFLYDLALPSDMDNALSCRGQESPIQQRYLRAFL